MSGIFDGPTPDELDMIAGSHYLRTALPTLEAELEQQSSITARRIFDAIRDGNLTPEKAMNAWHELYGYERLLRRLRKRVRHGESIGNRVADGMTIGDD